MAAVRNISAALAALDHMPSQHDRPSRSSQSRHSSFLFSLSLTANFELPSRPNAGDRTNCRCVIDAV
ncbi:MAG: hypothetical protein DMF33_06740 [Verrucomicrobia bacterium]|nr:MAG: hypothetical protein DMF33_06740 [Verrucomicrobiota bacterium]